MISSDPVVSSPDPADSPGFPPSPDKVPLIGEEEKEREDGEEREDEKNEGAPAEEERTATSADPEAVGTNGEEDGGRATDGERHAEESSGGGGGGEEEEKRPLQLSVPDLINKEADSRAKSCDVWLKVSDSRLASTPRSGKAPLCRISLGEDVLLPGNGGAPYGPEELERHPDLLSFE